MDVVFICLLFTPSFWYDVLSLGHQLITLYSSHIDHIQNNNDQLFFDSLVVLVAGLHLNIEMLM